MLSRVFRPNAKVTAHLCSDAGIAVADHPQHLHRHTSRALEGPRAAVKAALVNSDGTAINHHQAPSKGATTVWRAAKLDTGALKHAGFVHNRPPKPVRRRPSVLTSGGVSGINRP